METTREEHHPALTGAIQGHFNDQAPHADPDWLKDLSIDDILDASGIDEALRDLEHESEAHELHEARLLHLNARRRLVAASLLLFLGVGAVALVGWLASGDVPGAPTQPGVPPVQTGGAISGEGNESVAWPRTLDPHRASSELEFKQIAMCYETLYTYSPLEPNKVVPLLAKSLPIIGDDLKTLTIPLREDVYFTPDARINGGQPKQMTAEDVYATIMRFAYEKSNPHWWMLENRIAWLDANRVSELGYREPDNDLPLGHPPSALLRVVSPFSIEIRLTHPQHDFLNVLCHPAFSILSSEAGDQHQTDGTPFNLAYDLDISRQPIGTGPYILDRYVENSEITWLANPSYRRVTLLEMAGFTDWQEREGSIIVNDGGATRIFDVRDFGTALHLPLPLTREVRYLVGAGEQADVDTVRVEYKDENLPEFLKLQKDERVHAVSTAVLESLIFNMNDRLFGENVVGNLLRTRLAKCIYELVPNGFGVALEEAKFPGMLPGFPEIYKASNAGSDGLFSPEMSTAQALTELGYDMIMEKTAGPDGRSSSFLVDRTTGKQIELVVMLRQELCDLDRTVLSGLSWSSGIKITTVVKSFPEFLKCLESGEYQAALSGWVMDLPDASDWYRNFVSEAKPRNNYTRYSSEEYDQAYALFQKALLHDAQKHQFPGSSLSVEGCRQKLEDILRRDAPVIPLYAGVQYIRVREGVKARQLGVFNRHQMRYWHDPDGSLLLEME